MGWIIKKSPAAAPEGEGAPPRGIALEVDAFALAMVAVLWLMLLVAIGGFMVGFWFGMRVPT